MYTGERILPGGMFNVTHQQSLAAYEFAAKYVSGKRVLDAACGDGYGVSLLGKSAKEVVGVDLNPATVAAANGQYGDDGIRFVQGNLFSLREAVGDEPFDVICCFQAIEHVQDHDAFLQALASVSKPGGIIIVSTPNTEMFHGFNPYHVHEVGVQEYRQLFARHFKQFELLGVFGNEAVMEYRQSKQKISDTMLKLDFLRAREWLPVPIVKALFGMVSFLIVKRFSFLKHRAAVANVTSAAFSIRGTDLVHALDFIAVATRD